MWVKKIVREDLNLVEKYRYGKPIQELQRELGFEKIVKLCSNESPWPLPDAVREAIVRGSKEVQRYPEPGSYFLRKIIASKWGVSPQEVIIGAGTEGILHSLFHAIINPGEEIVLPTPTYPLYKLAAIAASAKCIEINAKDEDYWTVEDLISNCSEKTKALIICNPNNPTGKMIPRSELIKLAVELESRRVLLIVDEAYAEYVDDPAYLAGVELFRQVGRVVVIRTFSKIYGLAALRVAYAIAPKVVVDAYDKTHPVFEVNSIAQRAATAALAEEDHVRDVRIKTIVERKKLLDSLRELGMYTISSCANFLLVKHTRSDLIFELLLKEGVIVRKGSDLGLPGHLRVSVGLPEENEKFLASLKKVLTSVEL